MYSRRLQLSKTLTKDPKKAKHILKEKADFLQKGNQNLFWFFLVGIVALLLLPKSPFGQALHRTTTNHMVERDFTTIKKLNNRDRHNAQSGGKQNNKWNSGVSGKQSSGPKPVSLVQKISKIDSRGISNKCSPFSKKNVLRKNPKLAIGWKISSFQQELAKIRKFYI